MNWREDLAEDSPELQQSLENFKASLDAWSDAALSLPRTAKKVDARRGWQTAMNWAIGCLLAVCSLTIAVHLIAHRQEAVQQMARKALQASSSEQAVSAKAGARTPTTLMVAPVQQQAEAQDEALLASVDQDVSEQVPAAMEPLAQLMEDNGTE